VQTADRDTEDARSIDVRQVGRELDDALKNLKA
jgi:hypothetical protein